MGLNVITALSAEDFVRACMAQFPGEGVTAQTGEEGELIVTFDNEARGPGDAAAVITAWSASGALLGRAKAAAMADVDVQLQAVMAGWTYTFGDVTYPIPITDSWLTRVQAINTGLGLAGGGADTVKFPIAPGTFVDMTQAEVQAMGLAAFTFEQLALTNAGEICTAIKAATTPEAAAAVSTTTGWPSP